jgi:hypothetical protein
MSAGLTRLICPLVLMTLNQKPGALHVAKLPAYTHAPEGQALFSWLSCAHMRIHARESERQHPRKASATRLDLAIWSAAPAAPPHSVKDTATRPDARTSMQPSRCLVQPRRIRAPGREQACASAPPPSLMSPRRRHGVDLRPRSTLSFPGRTPKTSSRAPCYVLANHRTTSSSASFFPSASP